MAISLERIKKRPDFLRVAALRRKWATLGLILQVAPNPEYAKALADDSLVGFGLSGASSTDGASTGLDSSGVVPETMVLAAGKARVGFTTSKKVGNAVARNRARRRLRAAVAEVFPRFAKPGHDYVVIGRTETITRNYSLLLQDLKTALKRVGAFVSDDPKGEQGKGSGAKSLGEKTGNSKTRHGQEAGLSAQS